MVIEGVGLYGLKDPGQPLNMGNSGTAMRLMAGVLAGQSFPSTLVGDDSLSQRPMTRVVEPLRALGADISVHNAGHPPIQIKPVKQLRGVDYVMPVASAQVKGALLLAGLYADGPTTVRQSGPSRDHTERMLAAMGAEIETTESSVTVHPIAGLRPCSVDVPGDISAAAFLLVAATLVPGSEVTITRVGINPTRTGLLEVLQEMGVQIAIEERAEAGEHMGKDGEPMADVTVHASELHGIEVSGDRVVRMIDEFPVFAVVATQAHGTTIVRDAAELRVKESDRIAAVVTQLRALGARIEERSDGFVVEGPTRLRGGTVDSHGDHRLAMALAVAGLIAHGEVVIERAECISDSFPGFVELMRKIGAVYD